MKPTPDDEQELKELFDATAATPDTALLERLERAAAARPAARSAQRRPVWPLGVAALLAAAAGTPLLWRAATPARPEPSGALERTAPRAAASGPATPSSPAVAVAAAPEDEAQAADDDVVDVLDDLALDPGDLTDAELDAWISAAGSTLDG